MNATMCYMSTQKRLDMTEVARRLAARRFDLHLEQVQVADKAGLSRAYISRLERGAIPNPKVFDLERVATALGTSVGELMHAAGPSADALRQEVVNLMGPGKAEMVEEIVRKSAGLSAAEIRLLLNVVRTHAKEVEERGDS